MTRTILERLVGGTRRLDHPNTIDDLNTFWTQSGLHGIQSLDDLRQGHVTAEIRRVLGVESLTGLKERLVALGCFSYDLEDYTDIESIAQNIIDNFKSMESSEYFSRKRPEYVLNRNREIFLRTNAFKEHMKAHGIRCLDDAKSKSLVRKGGISYFIGEGAAAEQAKKKLIEVGAFSECLADYTPEDQEYITKQIFDTIGDGNSTTDYISPSIPDDILRRNREIILQSASCKDFLNRMGVFSLNHIMSRLFYSGFSRLIDSPIGNTDVIRDRLIEYGVFSLKLREYPPEIQEMIYDNIVEHLGRGGKKSAVYLSERCDQATLDENRTLFAQRKAFRRYRDEQGWITLDHITCIDDISRVLMLMMGCTRSSVELRDRLAQYGAYEIDLSKEEPRVIEAAAQKNIERAKSRKDRSGSAYFNDNLDTATIQSNTLAILGTRTAQEFLAEEGVNLDDLTHLSINARRFLDGIKARSGVPTRASRRDMIPFSYRVIHKEWQAVEVSSLYALVERFEEDIDGLLAEIRLNRAKYQDMYGASINAIYLKMERLGILPEANEDFGIIAHNRTKSGVVYPFPQIHKEEYPDVLTLFRNLSILLRGNRLPYYVPILSYDSATHEQFHHATLPIEYKGADIDKYTPAEQQVIAVANGYISDSLDWTRRSNGDIEVPLTVGLSDPRIVARQDAMTQKTYVQIIFRRRFNPANVTDTVALIHGKTEYLHFKHERELTFEQT